MKRIHRVQYDVNTTHRYITLLAMRGETAITWEEEDFEDYHLLRLRVDSMMLAMQRGNEEFVSRAQIDTLRHLLANKEEHLHQIMQLFKGQVSSDVQSAYPVAVRSQYPNRDSQEERRRGIFRGKGIGASNAFRLRHTPRIEQGTTIHTGRTAENHRHLC